ncbi:MAG: hypothetical protein K6T30_04565, partial [Alicyclobacillus sp.]|nr:hypothetical protein [Alicyclobacillus sp.]
MNVSSSIANVLAQLHRAGVSACVVVAKGCSDDTAAVAERQAGRLGLRAAVVTVSPPLGPDVPRAVGLYAALRLFRDWDSVVFVDGDWRGSFGPSLEAVLRCAQ